MTEPPIGCWGHANAALISTMSLQAPLRVHPVKFAGLSVKDKLKQIRKELKGAPFTTLDSI